MEDNRKVIAVVVTYNRKKLLKEAIEALLNQDHNNCDILVVDNASTDGTKEYIDELLKNTRVHYENTGANLGGAGGFNYGMKRACQMGCDFIWVMDDDCIVHKDTLTELLNADKQLNGNYGFLSSKVLWKDGNICKMNIQKVSLIKKVTDWNIEIQKIEEFTADCECKIKNDLNVLLADINDDNGNDGNDNNNNESDNASNDKSANVFECLFKSENLLNNFAFYFTSSCTLIEVVSFILYTVFNQNINLQKYAPKKNNGNENEIEKEKEKNENNDFNSNLNEKNTNQIETPEKAINNNIPTEENIRPNSVLSSIEKFTSNPPPRHSIFYRYKWIKNKPKILSLENSHDEDLDIQSRDEADPENEIRRKIKNFSFFDKNSSVATSYLEDSLEDSMDKKTETSKNKITFINEDINKNTITEKVEEKKEIELTDVKIKKEFDIHENPLKRSEKLQTLKTNLPQVLTREENARKRKRVRSIKNIPQNKESTYPIKKKEEPKVIKLFDIYITVLFIKQHIINFFSCLFKIDINNNTCLHPESFIPLQMKINRFIFMIIVNIFFNTILLTQKYFIQKYNYFNDKYDLEKSADKNLIISAGEKISYAFGHCILKARQV